MKKNIILLFSLCFYINTFAEGKFHVRILNEISYQQAQSYERKWEISIFTYTNPQGISTTRYFLFAPGIKHNSELIIKSKRPDCPWQVLINGSFYYASFDNDRELKVGDKGVLQYNGNTLYFLKEQ